MKVAPFSTFREESSKYKIKNTNTIDARRIQSENATIKGVLLNTHIKKQQDDFSNFDSIASSLLIPENIEKKPEQKTQNFQSFDIKKALKPLLIATGATLGGMLLLSSMGKLYSNHLTKDFQPLPGDLPRSMNLLEETDLAVFRALRSPNCKNILGLAGVALMSIVTLISKNFTDGFKEIWIKKQECDINHDFQENLISVETEAFKGKLDVVNTLLSDTTNYFKKVLSNEESAKKQINFQNYLSFKGKNEENPENKPKKSKLKTILALAGSIAGIVGISYLMFANYKKTVQNLDIYKQRMTHNEISSKINEAIKNRNLEGLKNILKLINATEETMKEHLSKLGLSDDAMRAAVEEIKKSEIYAQAPEALAGVSEKIQYYCYVNEPRGHLYNWILEPDNKFNKYLFLSLTTTGAVGYVLNAIADAIKAVTVTKENTNSELNLRKKLISTEINNFKSKKLSAINPMIDNFIYQLEHGKSKQELKEMAENILIEIKNGPPYVYS